MEAAPCSYEDEDTALPPGHHGEDPSNESAASSQPKGQVKKSFRFWVVIAALSLTGMLAALESTIITSALPTITSTLGGGNVYVWIPNSYLLASIAILPFIAQLSDIFGRRWPLLCAVALFILGSVIAGTASSFAMLISGRTVYVSSFLTCHDFQHI